MRIISIGGMIFVLLFTLILRAAPQTNAPTIRPSASEDEITVYFAPDDDGAETAIISHIDAARHDIDVQSFHFTSQSLANALIAAKKRGVNVRMVIDAKAARERNCQAKALLAAGIPLLIDAQYHTAHNKIMIFDNSTVLTGSYNYTDESAQLNAENAVFIDGKPTISAAYIRNFELHLEHSQSIKTADDLPSPTKSSAAKD